MTLQSSRNLVLRPPTLVELQRECRAMEHSKPEDILERVDYRIALASLQEPELPNAGERRRRRNGDDDDEWIILSALYNDGDRTRVHR